MSTIETLRYIRTLYDSGIGIPCIGAVKALDEAIAALERDRWISVEDRLPEDGGAYLVVVKEKWKNETDWAVHVDVASNYGSYVDGYWDTFNDWCEGQEVHISHWMPLPEPSEEDNNGG